MRAFHRDSAAAELTYRSNLVAGIVLSLFWLVWAMITLRVFYDHVAVLHGWRYQDALLVLSLFFSVNGLRQALFQPSMLRMTEYIEKGTLDLFLTKPISTQFLVSFRYVNPVAWIDCTWGGALAVYCLVGRDPAPSAADLVRGVLLLGTAVVLLYCLSFGLQTLTLWTANSRELSDIVAGVIDIARFPIPLYGPLVSFVFTTVVPVAFFTTVPAQALMGQQGWRTVAVAIGVAGAGLLVTRLLWTAALRGYQGVSS
ncbi:ABC transporter permease [Streptomyces sp. NPDC056161]|uniref:ABC transporter permease n=1 Tax=Streptomyces sp. NPDC056161 TaxID=3345732 RepID=UPI0035DC57D6